jgi:hypothetical protein
MNLVPRLLKKNSSLEMGVLDLGFLDAQINFGNSFRSYSGGIINAVGNERNDLRALTRRT